jgi:hypothetical protein
VAVEIAGADHHRVRIVAVGEPAAEAGMHPDVHQHPTGAQDPDRLSQHRRVGRHVGVDHHRDDGGDGEVADRQPLGIGPGAGKAAPGVAEHPARQVDAHGRPAQLANPAGMHAGAAADVQAGAAALAEEVAQGPVDAQGVGVCPPTAGSLPGDELLLVPVGDLVIGGRRRHRSPPGG